MNIKRIVLALSAAFGALALSSCQFNKSCCGQCPGSTCAPEAAETK